jgi:dipeptidyl aminopeptidase/acylaminoacyl peptidase
MRMKWRFAMGNDVRRSLQQGAGSAPPCFGVSEVLERSRALRRRRTFAVAASVAVVMLSLFLGGRAAVELFGDRAQPPVGRGRQQPLIAYGSNGGIFVLESPGAEPRNLTKSPEEEMNPAVSPNGSTIVFERTQGPDSVFNWALFALPIEGGDAVRLTPGDRQTGYDRNPAWSPDGKRIAFVRHIARGTEILGTDTAVVVINGDGSGPQELTERPGQVTDPEWSPDGRWIYFSILRRGVPWIARVDARHGGKIEMLFPGFRPLPLGNGETAFLRTVEPRVTDVFSVSPRTGAERRWTRGLAAFDLAAYGDGKLIVAEHEDPFRPEVSARLNLVNESGEVRFLLTLDNLQGLSVGGSR